MFVPLAALTGVSLHKGQLHYPLYMNVQYTPAQNATLAAQIAMAISILFSTIPAFWVLRPEIASRRP